MTLLLVAAGAIVGAPARFITDLVLAHYAGRYLPWGTLVANTIGSPWPCSWPSPWPIPAGAHWLITGFCGALTTYSTLSYETLVLVEDGRWHHALANVAANLAGGLAASPIGFAAAHLVGP